MKLIHLSDLHIGKQVNGFSMLPDQIHILKEIIKVTDGEMPDAVLIAGDVYDKSVPSAEAVRVFDDFLWELARRRIEVFVISGNHDSPERLAFGSRMMGKSGIHLSPVYTGTVEPVRLSDAYGEIRIYLLPFLKPAQVRAVFPEREICSYTEALRTAVEAMQAETDNSAVRNILIAHQFVTGAERTESEEISVGGLDNVDAAVFAGFDYTALGHIHRAQNIAGLPLRYCGTPLKYSFSEANHKKSVSIVELLEKGNLRIRTAELVPLHDLREIKGTYMELADRSFYAGTRTDDYLHVTLTDEFDIPDAVGKLRAIYPNLMKLDYDNTRTRNQGKIEEAEGMEEKTPLEIFAEFYRMQNGQEMNGIQRDCMERMIERIQNAER